MDLTLFDNTANYVVSGLGSFELGNEKHEFFEGDIVMIEPGEWAIIHGQNLKILIICNPPFSPDDYEEAE